MKSSSLSTINDNCGFLSCMHNEMTTTVPVPGSSSHFLRDNFPIYTVSLKIRYSYLINWLVPSSV